MMYEELVKQLRYCATHECEGEGEKLVGCTAPYNEEYEGITTCNDVLQMRAADAIEELSKPRWIPVTERLPTEKINPNTHDFEYVLCTTIWGDVRPFKYGTPIGSKDAHFWNGAGYVDAYVSHWLPLPEPPKEEA